MEADLFSVSLGTGLEKMMIGSGCACFGFMDAMMSNTTLFLVSQRNPIGSSVENISEEKEYNSWTDVAKRIKINRLKYQHILSYLY